MKALPHITVCVCTYKRTGYLRRLLAELAKQENGSSFSYSIVVADNDRARSAEAVVNEFQQTVPLSVRYVMQPEQNIALTRNAALAEAHGEFVAFIDDDEFPIGRWLLLLYQACETYQATGAVGSVPPSFEEEPPDWVIKGKFCERERYPTGTVLDWTQGRTGNLLFRRSILNELQPPFRPQFLTAEDQDFFRRAIDHGAKFIWCDEAMAYEAVPPSRWQLGFLLRRALLRGKVSLQHPTSRSKALFTSFVAVPAYWLALPFLIPFGQHVYKSYLVRSFDHLGRIMGFFKVGKLPQSYVTE